MAVQTECLRDGVRYEFAEAQMVSISLDEDDHRSEPQQISAYLLNLSPRGAKLAVPSSLPQGKTFRLKLTVQQFAMDFFVAAKVCWTASEGESGCVMGCQFDPGIPGGLLGRLASEGALDRRGSDRDKARCSLMIAREGAPATKTEKVMLQNYSAGGFCIEAWRPLALGERFQIVSARPDANVAAVTHWQIKQSGMFTVGCGYGEDGGWERLERALSELQ
jgi:hypothetical protein